MVDLLYLEEHIQCKNYSSENHSSFRFFEFNEGSRFSIDLQDNYGFIFILDGKVEISSYCSQSHIMERDVMCSLEYGLTYSGTCHLNTKLIVWVFDRAQIACDKFSLFELKKHMPLEKKYFRTLQIRPQLRKFLEGNIYYLENKMYCRHLQDLKQSEWFFLMRAFYEKEQNAMFFAPLLEDKNQFILLIKKNAARVSSVAELADVCNMSTKTLTRNFKKHFKTTPKQWLLLQKKESVKLELLRSGETMERVSHNLGFSSAAHLNLYCKKFFDQNPKQIREDF